VGLGGSGDGTGFSSIVQKSDSPNRVVGSAGEKELGLPVDVETPDSTAVAVVSPQALAVDGVPDVGLTVLGAGEEKVALAVVLDLRDGLFVTVQANWLHCGLFLKNEEKPLNFIYVSTIRQ
jgi:hypothetical protein